MTTASNTTTFQFLALPPEVRNRIYEWALCPTSVLLLTRSPHSRLSTDPILTPQILATCRAIYQECGRNRSFLFENEIWISIDAHDTSWPVISEARLPQHVLERIEKLCIVFDCTELFRADYEDVDFDALTALVSLKQVRFEVIYDEHHGHDDLFCKGMFEEVLARLPRDTTVICGVEDETVEQRRFLEQVIRRRTEGRRTSVRRMEKKSLETAVGEVEKEVWGTKAGTIEDIFASYRFNRSSVGRQSYLAI